MQAANTLPADIERLSGRISHRINDMIRDHPSMRGILPEPGTIDLLGDANRAMVIDSLSIGLADLSIRVAQGFFILILVLFLLAESDMLTTKVIRFFAATPGDANAAARILGRLTRQIRNYLVARTIINLGLGIVLALSVWGLNVKFPFALGLFAGLMNFIPYVGQMIGGGLPTLITMGSRLDRRRPDRGGGLSRGGRHRGVHRDAVRHGPIARHERHNGAHRLPLLGLPLGTRRSHPRHADRRHHEIGLPDGPRTEPMGRAHEPRLEDSGGGGLGPEPFSGSAPRLTGPPGASAVASEAILPSGSAAGRH